MRILVAMLTITLSAVLTFEVSAQDLPVTDIYVLSIAKNQKGKYVLGTPERITPWDGYDNQPYFLPDSSGVLYVSIRDSTKADIYKFTFQFGQTSQLTHTPLTGEYSPMLMPDKSGYSCVRAMEDDSTQYLCKMTKGDEYTTLFPKLNPVGYYCWASNEVAAMYVLGHGEAPQTLWLGNVKTGDTKKVGERIGRCLQRMPGKTSTGFYYVQYNEDSTSSTIQFYDLKKGTSSKIITTLPDQEDFAILPDGTFLMGSVTELYKYLPGEDQDWKKIADFEDTPVGKFYRIAVNAKGNKIALVSYLDDRP